MITEFRDLIYLLQRWLDRDSPIIVRNNGDILLGEQVVEGDIIELVLNVFENTLIKRNKETKIGLEKINEERLGEVDFDEFVEELLNECDLTAVLNTRLSRLKHELFNYLRK